MHLDNPDNIFESMVLNDDACFLCGKHLSNRKTDEHVFPKWLQRKHDLWEQQLSLLNQTFIKYRQLTIPCCKKCNNEHLGQLESKIEKAFRSGYKAVSSLPDVILYQWMGKIFYGILRRELQLYADLSDKEAGTIIPPELIQSFSSLHLFLQSIRKPFGFSEGGHFSALVVNMHYGKTFANYDFMDNLPFMVIALQSDDVGVILALQDAGLIRDTYGRYVTDIAGRKLVPIQFDELYAKVLYQVSLLTRVPKFITAASNDSSSPVKVFMMPLAGFSTVPVLKKWNQEDYAHCLAAILSRSHPEVTMDKIFVPPGKVMTWMNDASGNLTFFESDGRKAKTRTRRGRRTLRRD